jgi:hypothetical protein
VPVFVLLTLLATPVQACLSRILPISSIMKGLSFGKGRKFLPFFLLAFYRLALFARRETILARSFFRGITSYAPNMATFASDFSRRWRRSLGVHIPSFGPKGSCRSERRAGYLGLQTGQG